MIRPAEKNDIPRLLELLLQVGEVHHTIRPDIFRAHPCKYDAPALEALLRDERRPVFVLEEQGTVLGYAFCVLKESRNDPVLQDRKTLYIDDLCVDRTSRGHHVGSQLYAHVCRYARQLGCDSVTLNVWCGNDGAMAFYQKQNMKPRNICMEYVLGDADD